MASPAREEEAGMSEVQPVISQSDDLPPEYFVVDEGGDDPEEDFQSGDQPQYPAAMSDQEHGMAGGVGSIQELVNTALDSKLQGFQAQMQQMLSMIQSVSAAKSPPATTTKQQIPTTDDAMEGGTAGGSAAEMDATGREGAGSSDQEVKAAAAQSGVNQDGSDVGGEVRETSAQRKRRARETARQMHLEEVAKLKREREEFQKFLATIASALDVPIPVEDEKSAEEVTKDEEGRAEDGGEATEKAAAAAEEISNGTKVNSAAVDAGEAMEEDQKEVTATSTSETDGHSKESVKQEEDASDDVKTTEGPDPEETKTPVIFPAEELVKQSWEKVKGRNFSTQLYEMSQRICYPWPREDKKAYGRVVTVNDEVMIHLNDLNQRINRKSVSGLPYEQSRINNGLKLMDAMFRFQQRIHSYASYFLIALGQHIRGESSFDEETVSKLLFYLGKGLADACDTSVQGCMLTTRLRRRLYIEAMELGKRGNAQYTPLNKPFSEDLFPPDLREIYSRHNIELYTPNKKRKLEAEAAGHSSIPSLEPVKKRATGGNIPQSGPPSGGNPQRGGNQRRRKSGGQGRMQQGGGRQQQGMQQQSPGFGDPPQQGNFASNRNQGNQRRGNQEGSFQGPGTSTNSGRNRRRRQKRQSSQSYAEIGPYSSMQDDGYPLGRDRSYPSTLLGRVNGSNSLPRYDTALGPSSSYNYDSTPSSYVQPTSLLGYTSFSKGPSRSMQQNYPSSFY